VAVTEVDAFIVAVWYLLAGFVAILIAGFISGQIARIFLNRPYTNIRATRCHKGET
jgi:sorbitol-specific phosphotransferase system component IIC